MWYAFLTCSMQFNNCHSKKNYVCIVYGIYLTLTELLHFTPKISGLKWAINHYLETFPGICSSGPYTQCDEVVNSPSGEHSCTCTLHLQFVANVTKSYFLKIRIR